MILLSTTFLHQNTVQREGTGAQSLGVQRDAQVMESQVVYGRDTATGPT